MDVSSPEVVAARAVAIFAIERLIRERSNWVIVVALVITAILLVGTVQADGFGAFVVGLLMVIAATVTVTLYVVRVVVLRGVTRVGGGRDYPRMRPIVERHVHDVERAQGAIKFDTFGLFRLAWMARRPARLQEHVRQTASTLAKAAPQVVADVRREISAGGRSLP